MSHIKSFAALPLDIQISIWDYATYTDLGRMCITCHAINDLIGLGTESKVNRVVWRAVYARLRRDIPKFLESHRFWKWRSFVMAPPPVSRVTGGGSGAGLGAALGPTGGAAAGLGAISIRPPPSASLGTGDPRDDALRLKLRDGDPNCMYYEVRSLVQKYWPESKAWDATESHPRIEPYTPLVSVACPEHTKLHRRDGLLKTVLVGDSGVGKTSIINSYVFGHFSTTYVATIFDYQRQPVTIAAAPANARSPAREKHRVGLLLADTAGQSDYDRLRSISYPEVDCVVMCFSIDSRASFESLRSRWIPELLYHCGNIPIVICGTKGDLRAPTLKKKAARRQGRGRGGVDRPPVSSGRRSTNRSRSKKRRKSPALRVSKSVTRASPQIRPVPASVHLPQWGAMSPTAKASHKSTTTATTGASSNSNSTRKARAPSHGSSSQHNRPPGLHRAHHSAPTTTRRDTYPKEGIASPAGHSTSTKSPPRFSSKRKSATMIPSKSPPARRSNLMARARSQLFRLHKRGPPPKRVHSKSATALSPTTSRPGRKVQPLPSSTKQPPQSQQPAHFPDRLQSAAVSPPQKPNTVSIPHRDSHSRSRVPPPPSATNARDTLLPPPTKGVRDPPVPSAKSVRNPPLAPPSAKSVRDLERERAAASNAAAQVKRLQTGTGVNGGSSPSLLQRQRSSSDAAAKDGGSESPRELPSSHSQTEKVEPNVDSVKKDITASFLLKRLQAPSHASAPVSRSNTLVSSKNTALHTKAISAEEPVASGSSRKATGNSHEATTSSHEATSSSREATDAAMSANVAAESAAGGGGGSSDSAPSALKSSTTSSVPQGTLPSAFSGDHGHASTPRFVKSSSIDSMRSGERDMKVDAERKESCPDDFKIPNRKPEQFSTPSSSLAGTRPEASLPPKPLHLLPSSKFNSSSTNFATKTARPEVQRRYSGDREVKEAVKDNEEKKQEPHKGELKVGESESDRVSVSAYDDPEEEDEDEEEDELPILSHHRQASLISHQEIIRHLQSLRDAQYPIVAYVECSALHGDVDHVFGAVVDQIYRSEVTKKTAKAKGAKAAKASASAKASAATGTQTDAPRRKQKREKGGSKKKKISPSSDKGCVVQ